MFRTVWASILLLFRCFGSVSPGHSFHWFSIGFSLVFRMVLASIGLNPSSSIMRSVGDVRHFSGSCFVRFGHQSCCCSAVSEAFLQVIPSIGFLSAFRSCFAWFWASIGLNPSSSIMRSVGDVRHFSGSCFVRFGHQSCCCSAVSEAFLQVIPSIGFLSAFRSCFVRFGPQSCCCSTVSKPFLQVIPSAWFGPQSF